MKFNLSKLLFLLISILLFSCQTQEKNTEKESFINANTLHDWNVALEEAIVNDFFSPPVAGRIYAYANIAAYEALAQTDDSFSALSQKYDAFSIPQAEDDKIDLEIASIYAFYNTGIELVYAVEILDKKIEEFNQFLTSKQLDLEVQKASEMYGKKIAAAVVSWAKKDKYGEMRSYPKYQLMKEEGKWLPTPPDYNDALEPHWKKLRPFTLDSASQFRPAPPTKYDMDTSSQFYKELLVVYKAIKENNEERVAIAKFWDCNPLVTKHKGHVTYAEKKLTPGGHWVNIGRMVMKKEGLDLMNTAHTYLMITIGINDAFISCWEEKYNSNYIRPVTVIQKNLEASWTPILYTPNFPEYPSGHSVVSGSVATILTKIFGDNYAFTDSTEVPYGMPPRSFKSFLDASDEAAISRLYGGIHFMPAIEEGKTQGHKVGRQVLKKLSLKAASTNI